MSAQDWRSLHEWLHRVFPAAEAAEMFAEHIGEAGPTDLAALPEDLRPA